MRRNVTPHDFFSVALECDFFVVELPASVLSEFHALPKPVIEVLRLIAGWTGIPVDVDITEKMEVFFTYSLFGVGELDKKAFFTFFALASGPLYNEMGLSVPYSQRYAEFFHKFITVRMIKF